MADYRRVFDRLDKDLPPRFHAVIRQDFIRAIQVGVRSAKRNAPVKTGRLRRSIRGYVGGFRGVIYSELIYARRQEFGNRRMPYFVRRGWISAISYLRRLGYTGADFMPPPRLTPAERSERARARAVTQPRDERGRFLPTGSLNRFRPRARQQSSQARIF